MTASKALSSAKFLQNLLFSINTAGQGIIAELLQACRHFSEPVPAKIHSNTIYPGIGTGLPPNLAKKKRCAEILPGPHLWLLHCHAGRNKQAVLHDRHTAHQIFQVGNIFILLASLFPGILHFNTGLFLPITNKRKKSFSVTFYLYQNSVPFKAGIKGPFSTKTGRFLQEAAFLLCLAQRFKNFIGSCRRVHPDTYRIMDCNDDKMGVGE